MPMWSGWLVCGLDKRNDKMQQPENNNNNKSKKFKRKIGFRIRSTK